MLYSSIVEMEAGYPPHLVQLTVQVNISEKALPFAALG
jgi:hypothetical protein